jgi:broad specificity phosphatase PhoE
MTATSDPIRTDHSAPGTAEQSGRPGAIVLARHGEPALSRKIRLNSSGYRRWWAAYEAGGILSGQTPPAQLMELARGADAIFASTRPRAVETAEALVFGKSFVRDPLFIEAPLPPPRFPAFIRFNPRIWGVLSRFVWWVSHRHGEETRQQAQERARQAARRLVEAAETGQQVLVIAHGFFNGMVGVELTRMGWRCVEDKGFRYWATRRFERA